MIELKHVTLTMKHNLILDDINIHFEKEKIHGLVGDNGSGKSMLLKCICGQIIPMKGEILINGQNILGRNAKPYYNMGVIIDAPDLLSNYSGVRNLKILAGKNRKITSQQIRETMETVGLSRDMNRMVKEYSLGMGQRLRIAQAIVGEPDLLVLDDPFQGLDQTGIKAMRRVLLGLKERGATIIFASHNMVDIRMLCDTVCRMEYGQLHREQEILI